MNKTAGSASLSTCRQRVIAMGNMKGSPHTIRFAQSNEATKLQLRREDRTS